jgi:acyl carrier protein
MPSTPPGPPSAVSAALARRDFQGAMLAAVSNVTGYPPEALSLDQALDADLGIDSISRVEILASFSDLIPDMSKLDLADVSQIKTLADVLKFIEQNAERIGVKTGPSA